MTTPTTDLLLHREEVFRVQGAIFEVGRAMGRGFLEAVYQECLALEFAACGVPFRAQPTVERLVLQNQEPRTNAKGRECVREASNFDAGKITPDQA